MRGDLVGEPTRIFGSVVGETAMDDAVLVLVFEEQVAGHADVDRFEMPDFDAIQLERVGGAQCSLRHRCIEAGVAGLFFDGAQMADNIRQHTVLVSVWPDGVGW